MHAWSTSNSNLVNTKCLNMAALPVNILLHAVYALNNRVCPNRNDYETINLSNQRSSEVRLFRLHWILMLLYIERKIEICRKIEILCSKSFFYTYISKCHTNSAIICSPRWFIYSEYGYEIPRNQSGSIAFSIYLGSYYSLLSLLLCLSWPNVVIVRL